MGLTNNTKQLPLAVITAAPPNKRIRKSTVSRLLPRVFNIVAEYKFRPLNGNSRRNKPTLSKLRDHARWIPSPSRRAVSRKWYTVHYTAKKAYRQLHCAPYSLIRYYYSNPPAVKNDRTMSVEYRPRSVCCRADREKGVRECTQRSQPTTLTLGGVGTAGRPRHSEQHLHPFFPGQPSGWRRRKFRRKKFSTFQKILHLARCLSLLMDYSANLTGMFLVAAAPSQRQLQVGCWPQTSFGSKRKKEEVSKSLFVNFTNKFKASNFPTLRPPESFLRIDLHHLVF